MTGAAWTVVGVLFFVIVAVVVTWVKMSLRAPDYDPEIGNSEVERERRLAESAAHEEVSRASKQIAESQRRVIAEVERDVPVDSLSTVRLTEYIDGRIRTTRTDN